MPPPAMKGARQRHTSPPPGDKLGDAMDLGSLESNARRATTLLKAMSNKHRLMILCELLRSEKCVGELETIIGLSQSALSQHLARLRRDKLVATRRSAQTIYYSLAGDEAEAIIRVLRELYDDRGAAAYIVAKSPDHDVLVIT
jgi:ArsR family transcriptional regulator, virulence genes transcriptional regulator